MHGIYGRGITISVIAGMLLVSIIPATLSTAAYAQKSVAINGAGATFPFPLIDTWRVEYKKVNPDVDLNYQSIGSGGGVKQLTEKTVDFGASDAPLTSDEQGALAVQPAGAVQHPVKALFFCISGARKNVTLLFRHGSKCPRQQI